MTEPTITEWIDRCPACDLPFDPKAVAHFGDKPIRHWQTGMPLPPVTLEAFCVSGHSFDVTEHEWTSERGARVKRVEKAHG